MNGKALHRSKVEKSSRNGLRLLKLLNAMPGKGGAVTVEGGSAIITGQDRQYRFACDDLRSLISEGLVITDGRRMKITSEGRSRLVRELHPDTPFLAQQGISAARPVSGDLRDGQPAISTGESPLSRLYARKERNGASWLGRMEFDAGERLRSDFEKACLQPRVSANWEASVAGRGRSGNGLAELSDFAMDARRRVHAALDVLGPELAGAVMDICCFLKGLETVERERRWPPRSAKLMLKTGLQLLVRHYGLEAGRQSAPIRGWGADGYRPSL